MPAERRGKKKKDGSEWGGRGRRVKKPPNQPSRIAVLLYCCTKTSSMIGSKLLGARRTGDLGEKTKCKLRRIHQCTPLTKRKKEQERSGAGAAPLQAPNTHRQFQWLHPCLLLHSSKIKSTHYSRNSFITEQFDETCYTCPTGFRWNILFTPKQAHIPPFLSYKQPNPQRSLLSVSDNAAPPVGGGTEHIQ